MGDWKNKRQLNSMFGTTKDVSANVDEAALMNFLQDIETKRRASSQTEEAKPELPVKSKKKKRDFNMK